MSTTIKSLYGETLAIELADDKEVIIKSSSLRGCLYKTVDLLGAVAAETGSVLTPKDAPLADWERELLNGPSAPEAVDARNRRELALYGIDRFDTHTCKAVPKDAVVTLRNTLPEVTVANSSRYAKIGERTFVLGSVEFYDESIRNLIALREYVVAHPPVDEAQVDAIIAAIKVADSANYEISDEYARRLYLAGVRIVEDEDK